jgi:2-polyprenyl-6-methoxyphenol hydroxylase-like FAD-dependent oxidoreductase
MAMRRTAGRLNLRKTNRYRTGTGRALEPATGPEGLYLEPLNDPRRGNSYPARSGHWQPTIRGEPSPFKGNALVVGGGVVGAATASMFALRGWHTTLVDEQPAECDDAKLCGLETVLITRRSLDCLHVAGVRKEALVAIGHKVVGIMDHPGSVSTFLTKGLSEQSMFPVNMLTVDLKMLRQSAIMTLQAVPHRNAKVFHSHKVVAIIPGAKTAVVKPLVEEHAAVAPDAEANTEEKGVVIAGRRFEDNVEGITYDVMIGADGLDSTTRRLLDFPGQVRMHESYSEKWFQVRGATHLDMSCVQRWCHKFNRETDPSKGLGVVIAFPRNDEGEFSVFAHMPRSILEAMGPEEFVANWAPEMLKTANDTVVVDPDRVSRIRPAYTLYNEDLCDAHHDFPSILLVGDAAHYRNPFLMEGLSCALEDASNAVNNIDTVGQSLWDCVRQYSRERGYSGDCLRMITERSLHYAKARHYNPILRLRNWYTHFMHYMCPRSIQEYYSTVHNYMFPRPMEQMLRGRGYASYEDADHAQFRSNRWWALGRLFT